MTPISFQIDSVTHHPEFGLFEASFPSSLEAGRPSPILDQVRHVDDDAHESVPEQYASVSPVSIDLLGFVACSAETIDDFENRFRKPFLRDRTSIIELERKQDLEAPPSAAHTSSSL
jgi:hypothetical protein